MVLGVFYLICYFIACESSNRKACVFNCKGLDLKPGSAITEHCGPFEGTKLN